MSAPRRTPKFSDGSAKTSRMRYRRGTANSKPGASSRSIDTAKVVSARDRRRRSTGHEHRNTGELGPEAGATQRVAAPAYRTRDKHTQISSSNRNHKKKLGMREAADRSYAARPLILSDLVVRPLLAEGVPAALPVGTADYAPLIRPTHLAAPRISAVCLVDGEAFGRRDPRRGDAPAQPSCRDRSPILSVAPQVTQEVAKLS